MRAFKGKDWIKGAWDSSKTAFHQIQLQDLTAKFSQISLIHGTISWFKTYRTLWYKSVGTLGLITVVAIGGNQYVQANMNEVFHVYVDNQEAGVVSNPEVVEQFVLDKYNKMVSQDPQVDHEINSDALSFKSERAYKAGTDDKAALQRIDHLLQVKAVGVKLMVGGKQIAVVKDKKTAEYILQRIKSKYAPIPKGAKQVAVLSRGASTEGAGTGSSKDASLVSVQIMQDVEMESGEIQPEDLAQPEDVIRKLETGDVQPTKYTVREGDCVSCIADKFNIPLAKIYELNPWIKDDLIDVGDVLDLTILQPTLSVKTVEQVWENEEIQYDTVYTKDSAMLAGQTKVIKPGKNGLKKLAFELVKVNGDLTEETIKDEVVLEEPVSAEVMKGTKVILGEGTGKFAWPVIGASISSTFGSRWGELHAGVDLTSSNKSILSADNGKVIFAGIKTGYGNAIVIDHKNGYRTLYGHLSKILVEDGDVVEKGEKIGIMGSTGHSTGVHLHFEIQKSGTPFNPMKFLNR